MSRTSDGCNRFGVAAGAGATAGLVGVLSSCAFNLQCETPVLVDDLLAVNVELAQRLEARSLACAPLMVAGQVAGIISTLQSELLGVVTGIAAIGPRMLTAAQSLSALPAHWIPLGAGAMVALCGYLAFWAYFINALLGVFVSWAVMGAAFLRLSRDRWARGAFAP